MKNKILLGVVMILTVTLITVLNYAEKNDYMIPIEPEEGKELISIRLKNESDGTITNISLEDYIVGVVSAEMPASFETEALKAQAVAARTFAMYKKNTRQNLDYDLVIGVSDQAYKDNRTLLKQWGLSFFQNYLKIRDAVKETQGEVVTYNGEIINAFYFSMSNGYTENSELVFSESLPYLKSVESSWDNETLDNYEVTKTISKTDFCNKLEISCDNINIENIEKSDSGHVNSITINGVTLKGTIVRSRLGLRSTDFNIEVGDEDITFVTRGYGHGVGMSQYGANGMAKENYTYQEILKHYYQNTEIKEL